MQGQGVTIITHGFGFGGNADEDDNPTSPHNWVGQMGFAVGLRDRAPVTYRMTVDNNSGSIQVSDFEHVPSVATANWYDSPSGEVIILLDWTDLDGGVPNCSDCDGADNILGTLDDNVSTINIGLEVVNYLLGTSIEGRPAGELLQLPLHLIGHSRGTSVNNWISQDFALRGIWIDHFTAMDIHPLPGCDHEPVEVYSNILFADNWWRADGDICLAIDPDGAPLSYSLDIGLTESRLETSGSSWLEHVDIHLWYHATIAQGLQEGEDVDGISFDNSWWGSGHPDRATTGYFYSRIATRDLDPDNVDPRLIAPGSLGLHPALGGSGSRVSLSPDGWPNIYLEDLVRTSQSYTVNPGDSVTGSVRVE
jgi:hypothetical protein